MEAMGTMHDAPRGQITHLSMLPIQSALFMAPTPPAESPVSSTCVAAARSCCRKRSCITAAAMRFPRNCQPARSESSPAPTLQINFEVIVPYLHCSNDLLMSG